MHVFAATNFGVAFGKIKYYLIDIILRNGYAASYAS
jgi:hypothetical protein